MRRRYLLKVPGGGERRQGETMIRMQLTVLQIPALLSKGGNMIYLKTLMTLKELSQRLVRGRMMTKIWMNLDKFTVWRSRSQQFPFLQTIIFPFLTSRDMSRGRLSRGLRREDIGKQWIPPSLNTKVLKIISARPYSQRTRARGSQLEEIQSPVVAKV